MVRRHSKGLKSHKFRNKLLLNQWLISLFGIDPLIEHKVNGKVVHPFHKLAEPIRNPRLEGLDKDNLHFFFHHLDDSPLFSYADSAIDSPGFRINRDMLLTYEQNIVRYTQRINEKRHRSVVWKYYQWLTLLFVEIYLDLKVKVNSIVVAGLFSIVVGKKFSFFITSFFNIFRPVAGTVYLKYG